MELTDDTEEEPAEPSLSAKRKSRILAVRRGALGDFVLTLPALRALRESWPAAQIELLTLPAYGKMAVHFGFASGWRSLESAPAAALFQERGMVDSEWREWLTGFDTVVSWLPDRDGVFRRRLLESRFPEAAPAAFHQAVWLAEGLEPAARQFGNVPGLNLNCQPHALLPPRATAAAVQSREPAGDFMIALHPGSGSPRKNWPFARWVEVMTALGKTHPGIRWLIITGEAEEERISAMRAVLDGSAVSWEGAHALELVALTESLGQCAALFGHDSGISHLASACGLPCALLFGPTAPAVWAPASQSTRVLRAESGDLSALRVDQVTEWLLGTLRENILANPGRSAI